MAALKIICSLLLLASAASGTVFRNCNEGFPPHSVDITGCDNTLPVCTLTTGETYDVNATIVTDREVTVLVPELVLTPLGGDPIPVPLGDDLCPLVVTGCPIQPGTDAVLRIPVTITGTNLGLYTSRLRLDDQNGENVVCAVVEILIL